QPPAHDPAAVSARAVAQPRLAIADVAQAAAPAGSLAAAGPAAAQSAGPRRAVPCGVRLPGVGVHARPAGPVAPEIGALAAGVGRRLVPDAERGGLGRVRGGGYGPRRQGVAASGLLSWEFRVRSPRFGVDGFRTAACEPRTVCAERPTDMITELAIGAGVAAAGGAAWLWREVRRRSL